MVVPKLTPRIVEGAPFADGSSYYVMEGGSRRSLRGFGIRVYRTKKEYVVRFRGKPHHIGRTDLIPLSVAREEARKLLLGLLKGKQLAGSRKTMADLGADYLRRHARLHKAARSAEEDERMWQRSVLPALGDRLVHEVTAEQVQDLHVAMAKTPFAANRVLSLLSKAFNLAELWGWRERGTNPTRGSQRYPEPPRRRHLSSDEYRQLGKAINEARGDTALPESALCAIELLIYTGCRPGEVLGLRWEWVDLTGKQIRLPKAKADRPGKRARGRVIWLNEAAAQVLARVDVEPARPFVFGGTQPLRSIRQVWNTLCQSAGIEGATPYALRHYAESRVMPNRSVAVARDVCGRREDPSSVPIDHSA